MGKRTRDGEEETIGGDLVPLRLSPEDEKLIANVREKALRKIKPLNKLKDAFAKTGGIRGAMDLARWAAKDDPRMHDLVAIYDDMSPRERAKIEIEDLCALVSMHPWEFMGKTSEVAWMMGSARASAALAYAIPEIAERAAEYALDKDGFKDREKILQRAGIYPEKGPLVAVQQNQTTNIGGGGLPKFENSTKKIDEILNEGAIEGEIVDA